MHLFDYVPSRNNSRVAKVPQSFWMDDSLTTHEKALEKGETTWVDACTMMQEYGFTLTVPSNCSAVHGLLVCQPYCITPNDKLPLGQTRNLCCFVCLLQGEHSYIQDKMIDKAGRLIIAFAGPPVKYKITGSCSPSVPDLPRRRCRVLRAAPRRRGFVRGAYRRRRTPSGRR